MKSNITLKFEYIVTKSIRHYEEKYLALENIVNKLYNNAVTKFNLF
jgi:hypothetical protein